MGTRERGVLYCGAGCGWLRLYFVYVICVYTVYIYITIGECVSMKRSIRGG